MASTAAAPRSLRRRGVLGANLGDRVFRWGTLVFAASVLALVLLLGGELSRTAAPAIRHFAWCFLTTSVWDPVHSVFGVLFAIYGTVVSSFLALLLAVPIGLGAALFLSELAPKWVRSPISFLIELLAAVPSIVYGLWGVFVLVPWMRPVEGWLGAHLGFLPIFQGPPYGLGMLTAGVILAIMILPYITAVSRDVIQAVPVSQREAAYALGATRWEAIRGPVLRYARSGLMGAVILGLGRAMGETMAVTMVIGNRAEISASLFNPAYTLASLLANEFAEATEPLHIASLVEAALVLFALTILINVIARLLIWSVARGPKVAVQE